MMKMQLEQYRNKVLGCWLGKNIGGTLGAPFECKRGVFDVNYYTQELNGEPLPNDDLDLQLVWLNAVERFSNKVNAEILGEYWLSYITPSWCEYGACKNNMRKGLVPPLSGYANNLNRDSCGAFIRSEIWACLAPGQPQIAAKYAFEDAIVDHSYEGVYAEIFCAVIQSAAFVESNKDILIEIGLSYIPENCGVYRVVRSVQEGYKTGADWKTARKKVLVEFPGSFGTMIGYEDREPELDIPVARLGYDAPSNIGILIIGWYYGEDDFGKGLCIAASCGEDADCTAATLGSIYGIINGIDNIPEEWSKPIGNKIVTLSINLGDHDCEIPKTIDELSDRIIRQTPIFLGSDLCDTVNSVNGYTISMKDTTEMYNVTVKRWSSDLVSFDDILRRQPFCVHFEHTLIDVTIDYCGNPYISADETKTFKFLIENKFKSQQYLDIKWILPEGFSVSPSNNMSYSLEQFHGNIGKLNAEYAITAPAQLTNNKSEFIVDISFNGRHTKLLIPLLLLNTACPACDIVAKNETK